MNRIEQSLINYLKEAGQRCLDLKAVLFDMDGVLYNSMPNHAAAWAAVMQAHGMPMTEQDAYLHEGRTGDDTVDIISRRAGRTVDADERRTIYTEKADYFARLAPVQPMEGAARLLQQVADGGRFAMLVTGSGQPALLERLNADFPGSFVRERMVTAFDVTRGKPDPEPYLTALARGGLQPHEAIVVENAPLGVKAARAAGIFTIAVNTGLLADSHLTDAGAHLLYGSMAALADEWETICRTAATLLNS